MTADNKTPRSAHAAAIVVIIVAAAIALWGAMGPVAGQPQPLNPLGIKGVGEGGAIPVPAVMAQAFEDALQNYDLEVLEMPLSPNRLFELLHQK